MNALLHASWFPALGWTLLHSLWEGTLVVLVTALVLRLLRGASPRLRHAVAALGLLVMGLLPLRHLVPPHRDASPLLQWHGRPQSQPAALSLVQTASSPALRTRMVVSLERALPWVVLTWMLGAGLSLLRLTGGWAWLQRLRWRKAELAPDALQRSLLDLCRRAGLKRAVTLLMCEDLAGPSVVGILRPAILVPAGWFLNLPPDHVEALLAHELAHVLRHDYAVNLLQSLLEVVLFYHPGVWWLSRRIRAERELACDTFAVRLMGDAFPLAEALTDLERRGLGRASFEPAPAAHGGSLMERISHLLLPPRRTTSAPAFGAMTLMGLLLVASLRLVAQTPDPTPTLPPAIPQDAHLLDDPNAPQKHFYFRCRNEKDTDGKDIPYTSLMDLKADQMPLNQMWASFDLVVKNQALSQGFVGWKIRDESIPGPRINLDLHDAKPAEVLAVLTRLARQHGVEPYKAPDPMEPGPFTVAMDRGKDGQNVYFFHARRVSPAFLDQMLETARTLVPGTGTGFQRSQDAHPGPKVDALFEGITLKELEVRIRRIQAEAK